MRTGTYILAESTLDSETLAVAISAWLLDGARRQLSTGTLTNRRYVTDRLAWWLAREGKTGCGPLEVGGFLAYLNTGQDEDGGRWGTGRTKKMRAGSVRWFHAYLSSLFGFAVEQEFVDRSPMAKMAPPRAARDQPEPFSEDQVRRLLAAAEKTRHRRRDVSLIHFMLDTGARAAEVCGAKRGDLNLVGHYCRVLGKGNKTRRVHFGPETEHAVWRYLKAEPREDDAPLFFSERRGQALTVSGLRRLVWRIGRDAGVGRELRCSPHTFRHAMAIMRLENGESAFDVQAQLGHESVAMTMEYVKLARLNEATRAARPSPTDRLRRRR